MQFYYLAQLFEEIRNTHRNNINTINNKGKKLFSNNSELIYVEP
jgi:hypothetical protein